MQYITTTFAEPPPRTRTCGAIVVLICVLTTSCMCVVISGVTQGRHEQAGNSSRYERNSGITVTAHSKVFNQQSNMLSTETKQLLYSTKTQARSQGGQGGHLTPHKMAKSNAIARQSTRNHKRSQNLTDLTPPHPPKKSLATGLQHKQLSLGGRNSLLIHFHCKRTDVQIHH